jgi:hypothetical protein
VVGGNLLVLVGSSSEFTLNPNWNPNDPSSSAGTQSQTPVWHDLGTLSSIVGYNSSNNLMSVPGSGGGGYGGSRGARLTDPSTPHLVAGNDHRITTSEFFQLWGGQVTCELAVGIYQGSDHGPLYALGIYGWAYGYVNASLGPAAGGLVTRGSVGITDAFRAREACVPSIWGPGHF